MKIVLSKLNNIISRLESDGEDVLSSRLNNIFMRMAQEIEQDQVLESEPDPAPVPENPRERWKKAKEQHWPGKDDEYIRNSIKKSSIKNQMSTLDLSWRLFSADISKTDVFTPEAIAKFKETIWYMKYTLDKIDSELDSTPYV